MPTPHSLPLCAPGEVVAFGGKAADSRSALEVRYERLGARIVRLAEAPPGEAGVVVLVEPDRGDLDAAEHALRPGGTLFVSGPLDAETASLTAPHCVHAELRIEFGEGRAD